jgi:hypothetical protein
MVIDVVICQPGGSGRPSGARDDAAVYTPAYTPQLHPSAECSTRARR